MKCANCGTESNGRFCPSCGSPMGRAHCAECGADLSAGARFCTQCGAAVAGRGKGGRARPVAATGGSGNLPWYLAGGVLLLLIIILLVPMLTDRGGSGQEAPFAPGAATGAPPPLTGTPREQADRLYDRIMTAREQGDAATAQRFAPMAIDAYGMAQPLDDDGLYHLAGVHIVTGDYAAAIATAEEILARSPNHLLGLGIAAEAAALAGNQDTARDYHRRLLAAYDAEIARNLPEYEGHSRILPEYRVAAQRATGGGS